MYLSLFILTWVIQVVVTGIFIYLNSYLRQKGENKATKEDIKVITKKIEDIKKESQIELEKIKTLLQSQKDLSHSAYGYKFKALMEFFDLALEFRGQLSLNLGSLYSDQEMSHGREISNTWYKMVKSYNKIPLYVKANAPLFQKIIDLMEKAVVLHQKHKENWGSTIFALMSETNSMGKSNYQVEASKATEVVNKYNRSIKTELDSFSDSLIEFSISLGDELKLREDLLQASLKDIRP
ncbi:hypothetical protein A2V71_01450 [Candidatus Berkelbacteria bacterium RBG_13_40_8]|uniref:Uncharacterized protein n=1 Tax=Candidatus Berkelbacteria bacterium RBG_13_40_8 TaxID=1797467 RepID=A0A1F5DNZ9_9BACT|nr:MAG: hypothetical protein A2V71_01450 [Candidatus Berkelbacteria bacterium RBG_13_40_8]